MLIGKIEALKLEIKGKNSSERFYWKLLRDINELSFFFPPFRFTCSLYGQRRNSQSKQRKTTRDIFVRDTIKLLYTCYWMSNFKHNWNLKIKSFFCKLPCVLIDDIIRTIRPTLTTQFWVPKAIVKKMPPQFLESIQSKQRVSRKATASAAAAVFSTFEVDKSGQPRWTAGFLPAKSSSFRLLLATFCAVRGS